MLGVRGRETSDAPEISEPVRNAVGGFGRFESPVRLIAMFSAIYKTGSTSTFGWQVAKTRGVRPHALIMTGKIALDEKLRKKGTCAK